MTIARVWAIIDVAFMQEVTLMVASIIIGVIGLIAYELLKTKFKSRLLCVILTILIGIIAIVIYGWGSVLLEGLSMI